MSKATFRVSQPRPGTTLAGTSSGRRVRCAKCGGWKTVAAAEPARSLAPPDPYAAALGRSSSGTATPPYNRLDPPDPYAADLERHARRLKEQRS